MTVDFVATSKKIVQALTDRSTSMNEHERTRFIYNNAIDDAINFVTDMGKSNPGIRLTCIRLEREMRKWLPLREDDLK